MPDPTSPDPLNTAVERLREALDELDAVPAGLVDRTHLKDQVVAAARAALASQPPTGDEGGRAQVQVTRAEVVDAMQTAWDDFVGDTGCFPDAIRVVGRGPKLAMEAGSGNWATFITDLLNAALAARPAPPVPVEPGHHADCHAAEGDLCSTFCPCMCHAEPEPAPVPVEEREGAVQIDAAYLRVLIYLADGAACSSPRATTERHAAVAAARAALSSPPTAPGDGERELRAVARRVAQDLYAAEVHRQSMGWTTYCRLLLVRGQTRLAAALNGTDYQPTAHVRELEAQIEAEHEAERVAAGLPARRSPAPEASEGGAK